MSFYHAKKPFECEFMQIDLNGCDIISYIICFECIENVVNSDHQPENNMFDMKV